MERTCVSCGGAYEAQRASAKYCSNRCKKRSQQGHVAPPVIGLVPSDPPPAPGLAAAVLRELEAVGRTDTASGQAALSLARRVESGADTGAGLASLVREMRASLAAATQGAKAELSPLDGMRDELAARRRA